MIPPNIHVLTAQAAKQAVQNTPPHIQFLLRSGQLPGSSDDLCSIRLLLQETQTEIEHRHKIVEESTARILLLEETSKRYRSILSPIRRLPAEMLSSILTLSIEKNRFGPPGYSRSHASLLSSVCAFWRSVALENRYIWATIVIDRDFDPKRHPVSFDRLKSHLERSKSASVAYEFDLPTTISSSLNIHNDGPISTLFGTEEKPRRVGVLKFLGASDEESSLWLEARKIVELAASRLTFLHTLHFCDESDERPIAISNLRFGNVPLQRCITSLNLHPVSGSGALFALESFTNLSSVSFIMTKEPGQVRTIRPGHNIFLSLPFLLSLTLKTSVEGRIDESITSMSNLLKWISTPSLSSLSILMSKASSRSSERLLLNELEDFFPRTTALVHLSIRCTHWTYPSMKTFLQNVPSTVTDLGIGLPPNSPSCFLPEAVNGLRWRDPGTFLPKLTHAELFMEVRDRKDWSLIFEMIKSRARVPDGASTSVSCTPLKSVYVEVKGIDPKIVTEAKKLRDEGVHVFGPNF